MRSHMVLALVGALALLCCGDEAASPNDSRPLPDGVSGTPDGGADVATGATCEAVQTCAQACQQQEYAQCVAACEAKASDKAKVLLKAYKDCADAAVTGECQEECAAGPADQLCGQCALSKCISQWNDCRLDA